MVANMIRGSALTLLAGLSAACTPSLPPLKAGWTYVASSPKPPARVDHRDPITMGQGLGPVVEGDDTVALIAGLRKDIENLSRELAAMQRQSEREKPAMVFSIKNPSLEPRLVYCVYLAFRDLKASARRPSSCSSPNALPQKLTPNGDNFAPQTTQYVSLGERLMLAPGDTVSFPIINPDCPIPTHMLFLSEPVESVPPDTPTKQVDWKELWTKKGTTVLVSGEMSDAHIRDIYLRERSAKGLNC